MTYKDPDKQREANRQNLTHFDDEYNYSRNIAVLDNSKWPHKLNLMANIINQQLIGLEPIESEVIDA